ncbi:MAG: SPASM domain-containing protein, partial [Deltaproteobacteria bacterium]|nr:SPASM domain-containing protein [Deltaproteobacteria bacterium]
EITIIGGEALLRPDWPEICRAVVDGGMGLVIITNGLPLVGNERALATLRDLRPHIIGVSIDGATAASYRALRGVDAFDDVLALCHRLVADGHERVNGVTTFLKANLDQIDDFVALLDGTPIHWQFQVASRGGERFDAAQFLDVADYGRLTEKLRGLFVTKGDTLRLCPMDDFGYFPLDPALRFLHETWAGCIAGRQLVGIRSNGDVLGCLSLADDFVEANVRRRPLGAIWRDPGSFASLRAKERGLTGHCARCPHGAECRAGCSAMAYSATGSLGENPYCIRQLETERILGALAGQGR